MTTEQPSTETADFGTKQKKLEFSTSFLKEVRHKPYMPPTDIAVAGDPETNHGRALTGTFLDDGRARIAWGSDHEKIVFGLLSGSVFLKTKAPLRDAAGEFILDANQAPTLTTIEMAVTEGAPALVYLQGWHDGEKGDFYAVMQDGRQRRRGAMELQRRLDWVASVVNALGEKGAAKPYRRNTLIKIGKMYGEGKTWEEIKTEMAGVLPADLTGYHSPEIGVPTTSPGGAVCGEVGGVPVLTPSHTTYPASLGWLTESFAKLTVGAEDLGENTKRGWLRNVKNDAGDVTHVEAYRVWMKISVVGTNVDPLDPHSLLESVAAKEAQVESPPSLLAQQVQRIISAKKNPNDPESAPLYTRAAVRERLGMDDDTIRRYELLLGMCDEVKALIDSGRMSMNVALGKRESAFVIWPKKGPREPLPLDKQRLVLSHLEHEFEEESLDSDAPRFTGAAVMKAGKRLRDAAMAGKLLPLGMAAPAADEDEGAAALAATSTKKGPDAPTTGAEQAAPPAKVKRAKSTIDVSQLREHAARAIGALPVPSEDSADNAPTAAYRAYRGTFDDLALAQAVALVVAGAEPLSVLGQWPHVAAVIGASLPQAAAPDAPATVSEEARILDWISTAAEEASLNGLDKIVVTTATDSHGHKPTAEQAAKANEMIAEWTKAFQADPEAKVLEDYVLSRVVTLQNAA